MCICVSGPIVFLSLNFLFVFSFSIKVLYINFSFSLYNRVCLRPLVFSTLIFIELETFSFIYLFYQTQELSYDFYKRADNRIESYMFYIWIQSLLITRVHHRFLVGFVLHAKCKTCSSLFYCRLSYRNRMITLASGRIDICALSIKMKNQE
jgi:hypothetical protein